MIYNVRIGIHPQASATAAKNTKPLSLLPEDTFTYSVSQRELKSIKDFLAFRQFKLSDLNKVVIRLGYVIFEDQVKWDRGRYYRPNAGAPGGYEPIQQWLVFSSGTEPLPVKEGGKYAHLPIGCGVFSDLVVSVA
jgi:hypothetical protein